MHFRLNYLLAYHHFISILLFYVDLLLVKQFFNLIVYLSISYSALQVLLTTCKAMAPFTPFFTEGLYQNLHKVLDGAEESIHYCSFPSSKGKVASSSQNLLSDIFMCQKKSARFTSLFVWCFQREERIEQSVTRMMTVIDLARAIRERHNKPLKAPLKYIQLLLRLCGLFIQFLTKFSFYSTTGRWLLCILMQIFLRTSQANYERYVRFKNPS